MDRFLSFISRGGTPSPTACHGIGGSDADLDWEDWDPQAGSFIHHMMAGSVAGIAEHTVMFPVDTIKTFVQCQECTLTACLKKQQVVPAGMTSLEAASRLVQQEGFFRLWRGVSTMLSACVPAHAAYFSVLESCKDKFGVNGREHNVVGAAAAGAIATLFHDSIMTPMDVIKQRLQLGYYQGLVHCASSIARQEGIHAFYLSLPVTLFMNLPYGCVMVAANESIKRVLKPSGDYDTATYLLAGSGAGALAAAATTPLDLIKTRLQTQVTGLEMEAAGTVVNEGGVRVTTTSTVRPGGGGGGSSGGSSGGVGGMGGGHTHTHTHSHGHGPASHSSAFHPTSASMPPLAATHETATVGGVHAAGTGGGSGGAGTGAAAGGRPTATLPTTPPARSHVTSSDAACMRAEHTKLRYKGIMDAARQIYAVEGYVGFFRGMVPRLLVHTPSVAISWTTYETVKEMLRKNWGGSERGGEGGKP